MGSGLDRSDGYPPLDEYDRAEALCMEARVRRGKFRSLECRVVSVAMTW